MQRLKSKSTTEAYCEIAIAESNKRLRENPPSRQQNVMEAFQSRIFSVEHVNSSRIELLLKQGPRLED